MAKDKKVVNIVEVKNFTKMYNKGLTHAVKDLSFELHAGKIVGFLGHNGAGKSTTIKAMIGIHEITSGSITINGFDITKNPLLAKSQIGYVPDNHALYENLTGREFINYMGDLHNVSISDRQEKTSEYGKKFEIEFALDRQIKTYSHGMKQKVAIIANIMHNPKLWILDEPLTGLDPTSVYQIKQTMEEHAKEGNTVFFSSHIVDVVEKVCNEVIIISGGELVDILDVKELIKEGKSLEEVYIKEVLGSSSV